MKVVPNVMGNLFIRPIRIQRKGKLEIVSNQESRLDLKVGLVVSHGDMNGEIIVYHHAMSKKYRFISEELIVIKKDSVLATIELEPAVDGDCDLMDELIIDLSLACYRTDSNACGMPLIEKF